MTLFSMMKQLSPIWRPGQTTAFELMYGVGNLCAGLDNDVRYDARRLVELLIAGLRRPRTTSS